MDVQSRLFLRSPVGKLGIAPLTSMFFFGESTLIRPVDFRPEVHDSDGLLVHAGSGEWIWRPLENPRTLHVSSFQIPAPKGFGLVQRDRDFDHYQDLETMQQQRPSVWIAPVGDWDGAVELVEIPTLQDIHDNVVAYWVPARLPEPGDPIDFAYRMTWYGDDPGLPPGGRVIGTRHDHGTFEDAHRFVVDFEGARLHALSAETVLRAVVTASPAGGEPGEILEQQVVRNPVTGGWRLTFQVRPRGGDPLELRAFLQHGEDTLTETWSYLLKP